MLPTIFDASTIPFLQETVNFSQARHNVLAGNIANMDTPGYKVRDLSVDTFQQRLKAAMEVRKTKHEPVSPGIVDSPADEPMRQVRESLKNILYHDDSNVSLEHQITEINKNQMLHNTAITIMTQQFRLLQVAVSERV